MDKKKLLIGAGAAVLAVLAMIFLIPGKTEAPEAAVETTAAAVETTVPTEAATQSQGFENVALEGEPAPFDSETAEIIPATENQGSQTGTKPGTTGSKKPSAGTGTSTNKKPSSGSSSGSSGSKPSSGSNTGTVETLPPEVNVNMGVVEGEEDGGLDEEFEDSGNQNTTPSEPPAKPVQPGNTGSSSLPEDFSFSKLTYESYNAMSGTQQQEVIALFSSPEEFVEWYKFAEEEYKTEHPDIEIGGDGSVDAGDLKG